MNKLSILLVRIFSALDGLSWLVLLYSSLYLKRTLGQADAIRIPGLVHGVLFTLLCISLYIAFDKNKWPFKRPLTVLLCAIIPLAPFFLDRSLKKEQHSIEN